MDAITPPKTKLRQYLDDEKLSTRIFAQRIKCTSSYVSQLAKPDGPYPSRKLAREIAEKTGGVVTPNSFAGLPELDRPTPRIAAGE